MCLRVSSGSKSVTVVPSSTRPIRLVAPVECSTRLDQRGLAGAPVTNDQDVADTVGGVALHGQPASLDVAGAAMLPPHIAVTGRR